MKVIDIGRHNSIYPIIDMAGGDGATAYGSARQDLVMTPATRGFKGDREQSSSPFSPSRDTEQGNVPGRASVEIDALRRDLQHLIQMVGRSGAGTSTPPPEYNR